MQTSAMLLPVPFPLSKTPAIAAGDLFFFSVRTRRSSKFKPDRVGAARQRLCCFFSYPLALCRNCTFYREPPGFKTLITFKPQVQMT
jgi:hypothetical protein